METLGVILLAFSPLILVWMLEDGKMVLSRWRLAVYVGFCILGLAGVLRWRSAWTI